MAISIDLAVTLIIYASLFLNFFMVASFDSLGPRLAEQHGIDMETFSVVISVKSFVNMVMGPAMALASPKLPPVLIFTIGGVGLGGSYIALAFATNLSGFLIARGLHGIGTSGLMVGGMSVLMRCVPKHSRGHYTSIAYSAAGHAPLVAPLLSGLMYDKMGQAWAYLIPGIMMTAICVGSLFGLTKLINRKGDLEGEVGVPPSRSASTTMQQKDMWPCFKHIMKNPWTFIALAGIFCDGFSFGCCESTLPMILTDWDGGLSVLKTSLIYSVGPLTFTIVAPLAGYLVDRIGHYKVLLIGLGLYTAAFPFFDILVQTSLYGLGTCLVIAFMGASIMEVAIYPLIASVTESTGYANSDTIGYALNELSIQAGFAIGNLAGRQLLNWNGLLAMGLFVAGIDGIVVVVSLVIIIVIIRKGIDYNKGKAAAEEEEVGKIHEQPIDI
jgi:MFS family permease